MAVGYLAIGCDLGLIIPVVLSDLLPEGAQGFGIVLVHLLLPFFVLP